MNLYKKMAFVVMGLSFIQSFAAQPKKQGIGLTRADLGNIAVGASFFGKNILGGAVSGGLGYMGYQLFNQPTHNIYISRDTLKCCVGLGALAGVIRATLSLSAFFEKRKIDEDNKKRLLAFGKQSEELSGLRAQREEQKIQFERLGSQISSLQQQLQQEGSRLTDLQRATQEQIAEANAKADRIIKAGQQLAQNQAWSMYLGLGHARMTHASLALQISVATRMGVPVTAEQQSALEAGAAFLKNARTLGISDDQVFSVDTTGLQGALAAVKK